MAMQSPVLTDRSERRHSRSEGRTRQASFLLPSSLRQGTLDLKAELETKNGIRRPVRWACDPFTIRLKPWDDPDWRKGI